MKLYLLFKDNHYEGSEPIGVFSSIEKAQAALPHIKWKTPTYSPGRGYSFEIEEIELDKKIYG